MSGPSSLQSSSFTSNILNDNHSYAVQNYNPQPKASSLYNDDLLEETTTDLSTCIDVEPNGKFPVLESNSADKLPSVLAENATSSVASNKFAEMEKKFMRALYDFNSNCYERKDQYSTDKTMLSLNIQQRRPITTYLHHNNETSSPAAETRCATNNEQPTVQPIEKSMKLRKRENSVYRMLHGGLNQIDNMIELSRNSNSDLTPSYIKIRENYQNQLLKIKFCTEFHHPDAGHLYPSLKPKFDNLTTTPTWDLDIIIKVESLETKVNDEITFLRNSPNVNPNEIEANLLQLTHLLNDINEFAVRESIRSLTT